MKINYLTKTLVVVVLLATASPVMAADRHPATTDAKTEARVTELTNRLNEIKTIDQTQLSRAERKVLRKEVREIKKELAAVGGGVYLSVGAILLIALLLILLL